MMESIQTTSDPGFILHWYLEGDRNVLTCEELEEMIDWEAIASYQSLPQF